MLIPFGPCGQLFHHRKGSFQMLYRFGILKAQFCGATCLAPFLNGWDRALRSRQMMGQNLGTNRQG